jgi:uncharacterized protein with FMN-binding domain
VRRALPIAAVTAGGVALLANFHTTIGHVGLGTSPPVASTAPPAARGDTPTTPGTEAPGRAGTTAAGAPRTTTRPPGTATVTPSPTTGPSSGTRTIDGPDVNTRYGDVQVRISITGTRLVDMQALRLPSDRARSARISQMAGPELRQEALQAQSAHIDAVSGASYTSAAYIESLQGALDKVGK